MDYSTSHLKISVVPNLVKISTFFLKRFSKLRLNFVFSVKLWIIMTSYRCEIVVTFLKPMYSGKH